MSKRLLSLSLLMIALSAGSGCRLICCAHDGLLNCYRSHTFRGCGCGEKYICPWINNPPDCYDPCDDFGNFTGQQWWAPTYGCHRCRQSCDGCGARGMNMAAAGPMSAMGPADYIDDGQVQDQAAPMGEELPAPAQRRSPRSMGPPANSPPPSPPPRVGRRPRTAPPQGRPMYRSRQASLQTYDNSRDSDAVFDDGPQRNNMSYRRR